MGSRPEDQLHGADNFHPASVPLPRARDPVGRPNPLLELLISIKHQITAVICSLFRAVTYQNGLHYDNQFYCDYYLFSSFVMLSMLINGLDGFLISHWGPSIFSAGMLFGSLAAIFTQCQEIPSSPSTEVL